VVAIENPARRIFGLQYHPEVMHTEEGKEALCHFLLDISGVKPDWTMAEVLETECKMIEELVGGGVRGVVGGGVGMSGRGTGKAAVLHQ
jgi:GMP synthase (glutamine-hydrolysing)